jgi:carboxyl-terminal processing protease
MQNSGVMKRLRGPKGTEVIVKIKRGGKKDLLVFKIIRDKIPIHSVDASYMINKETGYIKINNFGSTTVEEFQTAFLNLQKSG